MDQFSLKGQTALLTGAARGLGLAFAESLASAGANIAVLDVIEPEQGLFDIRARYGVKVEFYNCNVTDRAAVNETVERVEREFGAIHICIPAAGVVRDEPFLSTTDSNLNFTFGVNFTGTFLVAQACANSMARRFTASGSTFAPGQETTTGVIIFIASICTSMSTAVQSISCYAASKAAVKGLVKPLAMELAPYGIRVNSLSPGYMMTDMMRGLQAKEPKLVAQFEKETLFGRIGFPEELKGAVLFLASRASGWFTGQDLLVDGGATAYKHHAVLDQKFD